MKKATVPIAKIKVPDVRVTAVYDDELRDLLSKSMAALGVLTPIVCVKTGEDYLLVDGLHRLQELTAEGKLVVDIVYTEGDASDNLLQNLVLNKVRGKTKASEMVNVIGALRRDYNMDSDKIAEKTGLTRDYIERLEAISKAAPDVQDALDKEIIGVGHAYQLSRLPAHIQQNEILAKYQVYRFTVAELRDQIDMVLRAMAQITEQRAAAPPPEKAPPPVYHCEGCAKEANPRYLRSVLLCPDCFGAVWRLAKEPEPAATTTKDDGHPA